MAGGTPPADCDPRRESNRVRRRDDAKRREVSAWLETAPSRDASSAPDTDAAIRRAAKVAIEARDYATARALLEARPSGPVVVAVLSERRSRSRVP